MHAYESVTVGDDGHQWKTPEGHDTGPENDSSTSHLESTSTVYRPVWLRVQFMVSLLNDSQGITTERWSEVVIPCSQYLAVTPPNSL